MRTIEISTTVFSAIWARHIQGEESEDQILARLLGVSGPRVATSKIAMKGRKKMRWIDDVEEAFRRLGGRAHYDELYASVRAIRAEAGRSLPPSTEAIIRREVENHSSDSDAYLGKRNLFVAPEGLGAGVWAIR
ncbi:MAG TPA: hypothetical protein PLN33_17505 [Hyphomonadaceae bacterium]|nr:hypothetical protein [Hyphomonadaceae bacterium]